MLEPLPPQDRCLPLYSLATCDPGDTRTTVGGSNELVAIARKLMPGDGDGDAEGGKYFIMLPNLTPVSKVLNSPDLTVSLRSSVASI